MIATEEKPLPDQTLKTTFTFNIPAQYIQILQTSSLLTSVIPNFVLGFVPPNESENNIQISWSITHTQTIKATSTLSAVIHPTRATGIPKNKKKIIQSINESDCFSNGMLE